MLRAERLQSLQVDSQPGTSDGEGWMYRVPSATGLAEARPANPLGKQGWTAQGGPSSAWRRRRWIRHRRRRLRVSCSSPGLQRPLY